MTQELPTLAIVESSRLKFNRLTGTMLSRTNERFMAPRRADYPLVVEDRSPLDVSRLDPFRIFNVTGENADANWSAIKELCTRIREEAPLGRRPQYSRS